MRTNEIRRTRTVEELVRVEYIAEDGTVFHNEDECKAYEKSALFVVSSKLKRLADTNEYAFIEAGCEDNALEIFDVQTQEDLNNLRQYLYLTLSQRGIKDKTIQECFTSVDGKRSNFVFDGVTYGHEVMVFWSCDEDWFWVYGDGSVDGYCKWLKEKYTKIITPEIKEEV